KFQHGALLHSRDALNESFMEYPAGAARPYSALMLAARITLAHLSVSSTISFPKLAGEPGITVPSISVRRACTLASARTALISLLSLSTISAGTFLGAPMPYQTLAS